MKRKIFFVCLAVWLVAAAVLVGLLLFKNTNDGATPTAPPTETEESEQWTNFY